MTAWFILRLIVTCLFFLLLLSIYALLNLFTFFSRIKHLQKLKFSRYMKSSCFIMIGFRFCIDFFLIIELAYSVIIQWRRLNKHLKRVTSRSHMKHMRANIHSSNWAIKKASGLCLKKNRRSIKISAHFDDFLISKMNRAILREDRT